MVKMTIDGQEIEVEGGLSVLQACEQAGAEIPRYCYHERLSVSGNCRMCLVEMERAPKPVASCAMPVGEGMVIRTNTEAVRNMRKGVMEFLLINHPLDCPICDQGGECDLQDQAVAYGGDKGRYHEPKRTVADHDYGPLVGTVMTRCIHCTRCVRFTGEIAGVPVLGGTFRGEHMEIGAYVDAMVDSELSGNLVDVCPVGALTSKPYKFSARPWELTKVESVDVLDAQGCNIRVDTRGGEIMRIQPRLNEEINEEWLGDKSRHACDGLKVQRLDKPYIRLSDKLTPASWDQAFAAIKAKLNDVKGAKISAIVGDQADCESMTALKDLMVALGSENIDCRQDGAQLDASNRASYIFNSTIAGIEDADAILIVGSNPRHEAPVLNARIRKRHLQGNNKSKLNVAVIGPKSDLTYPHENLGDETSVLAEIASGKHAFAKVLKAAKNPMIIVGQGALARTDGAQVLAAAKAVTDKLGLIKDGWNGFNVLHTAASRVGGLDLGLVPGKGGKSAGEIVGSDMDVTILLGADDVDMSRLKGFVVYIGTHGDAGAHRADVILPSAAYTEKNATFVNTEGRVQRTRIAVYPVGEAREDWTILRALSTVLGHTLPYDSVSQVRSRMVELNANFASVNCVTAADWGDFGTVGDMSDMPFKYAIDNYYMTDPISRASATMAKCSDAFVTKTKEASNG